MNTDENNSNDVEIPWIDRGRNRIIAFLGAGVVVVGLIGFAFLSESETPTDQGESPSSTIPPEIDYSNLSDFSTIDSATILLNEGTWEDIYPEAFGSEEVYDIKSAEVRSELSEMAERYILSDGLGEKNPEFSYLYENATPSASVSSPFLEMDVVVAVPGVNWDAVEKTSLPCTEDGLHDEHVIELDETENECDYVDWRNASKFQVYVLYQGITPQSTSYFGSEMVDIVLSDGEYRIVL